VRFGFIKDHDGQWPVEVMCDVFEVSRSGYYAWRGRAESPRRVRQRELVSAMRAIHCEPRKGCYGSPRMQRELVSRGCPVSENTVARLMQEHELRAATARKFRHTTDSNHPHPVAENVLNQEFEQERPNQVWVSDLTYVATREGWLYLVCVLDLFSRKVVGWSMSARMTSALVVSALQMALGRRGGGEGLLHHSDRGSQYASAAFQELLREQGIECSMSRRGNCYDNAVMESFFASLKKELIHQEDYKTRAAARQSIFEYIEVFYNRERRHSALGYISPEEFESSASPAA
jgi:transposase InsO family protein